MAKKKKKKRKTLEECDIWTMERADGSWAASVQSPTVDYIHVLAFGSTKRKAINAAKIKWEENYK
jgi:hypothetical protein